MWLTLLWENRRIVLESLAVAVVLILGYHYLVSNPKKIDELNKQVKAGEAAINMLGDISKGKELVNAQTFKNISTIRAAHIGKRTLLIHNGVLQALPTK